MENSSLSTNSSSSTVLATPTIRIFGAFSYGLLSSMSILMNLLLIAVLTHNHSQLKLLTFFTLAWQMIICDLMAQSIQLIVAVPITFAGEAVYGHPFWYYAVLFFDSVAFYGTLLFSALLTLSRVCIFFLPRLNRRLFSPGNIKFTISALWVAVFVLCSGFPIVGCVKVFSETGFYMYHDCPEPLPWYTVSFKVFAYGMASILPILMLVAYIICFIHIRYPFGLRHSTSNEDQIERARRQREKNFLIQSFLICGFLEVQNITFDLLPLLVPHLQGQWKFLATFVENWISILLNSISPIILFSFNRDVRQGLAELLSSIPFWPWRSTPAVIRVQPLQAAVQSPRLAQPLPGQRKASEPPAGSISRSQQETTGISSQRQMSLVPAVEAEEGICR